MHRIDSQFKSGIFPTPWIFRTFFNFLALYRNFSPFQISFKYACSFAAAWHKTIAIFVYLMMYIFLLVAQNIILNIAGALHRPVQLPRISTFMMRLAPHAQTWQPKFLPSLIPYQNLKPITLFFINECDYSKLIAAKPHKIVRFSENTFLPHSLKMTEKNKQPVHQS